MKAHASHMASGWAMQSSCTADKLPLCSSHHRSIRQRETARHTQRERVCVCVDQSNSEQTGLLKNRSSLVFAMMDREKIEYHGLWRVADGFVHLYMYACMTLSITPVPCFINPAFIDSFSVFYRPFTGQASEFISMIYNALGPVIMILFLKYKLLKIKGRQGQFCLKAGPVTGPPTRFNCCKLLLPRISILLHTHTNMISLATVDSFVQ